MEKREGKKTNNQTTSFTHRKNISQKKYADSAPQRQDPRSDRAMPRTQEKALSIATAANTSSLREKEREEADTQASKSSRS
jgi:hypothetical protein